MNYHDARIDAKVFREHFGMCVVVVECEDFKFRLLRTVANEYEVNIEPFLCLMLKRE